MKITCGRCKQLKEWNFATSRKDGSRICDDCEQKEAGLRGDSDG